MNVTAIVVVAVVAYVLWRYWPRHQEALQGTLRGPGTFDVPVVGESRYQKALKQICGGQTYDGVEEHRGAQLILEDTNRYDRNAVRVEILGCAVGYLSRDFAPIYRRKLKQMGRARMQVTCKAVIRGGWDRGEGDEGAFGVWLDIP